MNKRKQSGLPILKPVTNSKMKFVLELNCEWDFNRDLASADANWDLPHNIRMYAKDVKTFQAAFQKSVATMIFSRLDNIAESILLTRLECSPECEQSYQALVVELNAEDRAQAEQELRALELRTQALKDRLGK